jgi:peptide/nickel transport system permease protein
MKSMGRKNYSLVIGTIVTSAVLLVILAGFVWKPHDPNALNPALRTAPPSLAHIMGTDNFGRDIFSRILDGAGTTLGIAAFIVAIGTVSGILAGSVTGYFGGIADELLMRVCDTLTAFPSILLALVVISFIGPGKGSLIVALGLLFIPSFTRIVRTEFSRQRHLDYVTSAKLMGCGHLRIMYIHILPNIKTILMSGIAIGFNNAVLAEASMSFLGMGVQRPEASLGSMLSDSQAYMLSAPWYMLFSGAAISLLILGFGLLSEGLREDS